MQEEASVSNSPPPTGGYSALGVMDVLQTSVRIITGNLGTLVVIAILFELPQLVVSLGLGFTAVAMGEGSGGALAVGIGGGVVSYVLQLAVTAMAQGATALVVFGTLSGRELPAAEAVSRGLARFGTLFGAAFLVGLTIAAGLLFCIVPGVVIGCILAVVIPVVVIEKRSMMEAVTRSADLTSGNRIEIFLVYLVLVVPIFFMVCTVGVVSAIIAGGFEMMAGSGYVGVVIQVVIEFLLGIPMLVLYGTVAPVIYARLRSIKESASASAIAFALQNEA